MKIITLHGVSFESNIDDYIRYSEDKSSDWWEEDVAAVKRWNIAFDTIQNLDVEDLRFLNERHEEGQRKEDFRYYLGDVGLWSGNHPSIEKEIRRRKDFAKELDDAVKEYIKRKSAHTTAANKAIAENDYRSIFHPRYHELNNQQLAARDQIAKNAFIEDFGTSDRVGGIYLYDNRPLWLQKAWQTIHDYYLNCGGDHAYPEADFATVMYGIVSNVNGSNGYLMKQNTAQTVNNPTHWTHEKDFGKARVVSEGRTLRFNGQCDEVIVSKIEREKVIADRRNVIKLYREGLIKEIKEWPSVENPGIAGNEYKVYHEFIADNGKKIAVGHDLVDKKQIAQSKYKQLILDVTEYAKEQWQGELHVERWKRVLEALDPTYDYPYPPMTAAEAKTYAYRGWKRWVPVYDALAEIEAA